MPKLGVWRLMIVLFLRSLLRLGQMVSSVYREYKKFREKSIPAPDQGCPSLNQEDLKTLKRVESIYGGLSADHLWKLSHSESPWSYARGELGFDEPSRNEISKDIMGLYYKGFLESRDGTLFIRAEVTNINKESRSTFFLKGDRIVNVSNKDAFSFMLQNWDELEDE